MTLEIAEADLSHVPALQAIYAHWVTTGLASVEEIPPDIAEMDRRRPLQGRSRIPGAGLERVYYLNRSP